MKFCEMGVLCTISEMKKCWVLIKACLRSQAIEGWRGSQDHPHHTMSLHSPHALVLLAEVSLVLFYVRSTRRAASSTKDSEDQISRRQDWGSAHYFQYFQSLEYTHLIKTGGQTSILHTCTLGVSILTTQTRGEKMKKDLITVVLKRVSPP